MQFFYTYLEWIEWPLDLVLDKLDFSLGKPWLYAYDLVVTLVVLSFILSVLKQGKLGLRRLIKGEDSLLDKADIDAFVTKNEQHVESLQAVKDLEAQIKPLKRMRNYDRLGEIYSSLNRGKQAAKWFKKAGDRKRAAMELAKAGKTFKAAKMLMKEGDFATAARFYTNGGKHADAAAAYAKAGELAQAADAYRKAQRFKEAAKAYGEYFADARDTLEVQLQVTEACLDMLNSEPGRTKLDPEQRRALLPVLATRLEHAKRYEPAAKLLVEAGELARAGQTYMLADKLEEAANCLRQAGKTKEASEVLGRWHEKRGMWREAAQAYVSAGNFRRAGDCYAKVSDAVNSAKCYERSGEYYGAALAYAHAMRYEDAIPLLQRIPKDHRTFDQSRALLGRCYYELRDFERCAAALDNHLMGKRVEKDNMEYFDMLARAYEQLGKLETSRELLYKIQTVDSRYGDVAQRVSNIESRISMQAALSGPPPSATYRGQAMEGDETQVMQTVASAVGTRYRLEKELGRGGMGVVYLARDTQLDRPVALKFLGSLVDDSEEFRLRFVREAKAAAKISHPNIISIYDISASMGRAYIAMEYVEGQNLHRYVSKKGRLTPREAINIIGQACAALAAIHEAGIVHRDIKPDNILLGKGGLVKLTDFGLAKAEDSRITKTGVIMGTPTYMSPEQAMGKDTDARSDIYAIGLVLYEALTGEPFFVGGDVLQRQVNETPPPPGETVEGIPKALDDIVAKCLAKKPEERFQTARELRDALRQVLH